MKNKVDLKTFIWAIGVLITIIGWQTISMNSIRKDMGDVKVDIGSMQTDIGWIKDSMNKQNNISLK